ncbi:hypothetical protein PSA01_42300 [Pseudonocardia saturnea]|uniref:Uncharacterized protein n=1 Tax=Pseudonocardia saturnea TaxID=33909 RepID=A0ABQ0S2R5_9PSEU|nr:hypothetical protein Pdca_09180 [Pseudonocardia autotrophica]GEC27201.1 hypothetical protein PSA01_42300 [Pseudonocardia saturnea]
MVGQGKSRSRQSHRNEVFSRPSPVDPDAVVVKFARILGNKISVVLWIANEKHCISRNFVECKTPKRPVQPTEFTAFTARPCAATVGQERGRPERPLGLVAVQVAHGVDDMDRTHIDGFRKDGLRRFYTVTP